MTPVLALDYAKAAEAIGVSERTIQNLVARKELAVCRIGRSCRIRVRDIETFLEQNRTKTDAELEAEASNRPRRVS